MKPGPKQGSASPQTSINTAAAAWGHDAPDWVLVLAEACDRSSQNSIAKKLNYSGSVVSGVLNKVYKGTYVTIEQAVRGLLMAETHECPVAGEISKLLCLKNQKKAAEFNPTSRYRVELFRACRGHCPHSRLAVRNAAAREEPTP